MYDSESRELTVTVVAASSLKAADANGKSDPYVKLHILPDDSGELKAATKVVKKTLSPEFLETFTFRLPRESILSKMRLSATVFDHDTVGKDDFLGQAMIDLVELSPGEPRDQWFDLDAMSLGYLKLKLQYKPETAVLTVVVREAKDLMPANAARSADPYVKVYILPDKKKVTKRKTAVVKNSLAPNFKDETFTYELKANDDAKTLQVSLWDQTSGLRSTLMGVVQVKVATVMEEGTMAQWFQIFNEEGVEMHD